MAQATRKSRRKRSAPARKPGRWTRRRTLLAAGAALVLWLLLSHLVVRARFRAFLERTFDGEAHVAFAILWPHLDATAFGASVTGERFRLSARRVTVSLSPWALFGGGAVRDATIHGLDAELAEGQRVGLTRSAAAEGEAVAEEADLDPVKVPPLVFRDPRIALRREDGGRSELFATGVVSVEQTGDAAFRLHTDAGVLAGVPFEKLTARLVPRGEHVILGDLKVRAFNGVARGVVDVDLGRAGAANGELEWHFVEVEEIWRAYSLPYAEKRRGDCSGRIVFEADRPAAAALQGKGVVRLERARFHSPVTFKVFLVLGLPALEDSWITSADLEFSCEAGLVYLEEATVRGGSYELDAQGILSFAGRADLEVDFGGTTLAVSGALEDPTVKVLPLNALTLPFDRLFRERVDRARGR